MSNLLPTPVAAALGLGATVVTTVLRLPGRTVRLPITAVSSALSTMDALRREYDDLADRGERLVGRLRGRASEIPSGVRERADVLEDRVEDLVQRTPLGGAYERVEDTLEGVAERAGALVGTAAGNAAAGTRAASRAAADSADALAAGAEQTPPDQQPKGAPTPKETQPDSTRIDTAASASVVEAVEQAVEELAAEAADVPLPHDELPLPDYDHMTLGSLRGRLRTLSVEQLVQVRTYEKAHADRLPVVTMLDNRIAKLAADPAAAPTGQPSTEPAPEQRAAAGAGAAGSKVSPATTGPVINPPSQGDPTNPTQPRSTG